MLNLQGGLISDLEPELVLWVKIVGKNSQIPKSRIKRLLAGYNKASAIYDF